MKFKRYTYNNPDALPTQELSRDIEDIAGVMSEAGFDACDPEIMACELSEEWNGHPAGSIVVTDMTIEGYPFAVEVSR